VQEAVAPLWAGLRQKICPECGAYIDDKPDGRSCCSANFPRDDRTTVTLRSREVS
jgi:hypothetical protein